ncbi:TetR/AcrR family transcriptional regulator [Streptomyces sp. TRM66268-LWL]|uniref:TetR/AcrR family transcriptional regulator n=1 Tax=Streptomyces polyasparticus TaxID=2767826 RepID=A0ABR7SP34_9ACTN|nr:TetR/AcrR family transcriptional regulator [Streptomyces polyasparticus]MBC9716455.1 TetR/AcrR family transcriptional regulator [Streptomyces polyasparticus]
MSSKDSATTTSGSGDIRRSLDLLWGTGERATRGPKPALTLDRIVTAAVELADREGIAAVSMRRLSTELGTGTMSLYRYVPGKAELLDLMLDRVQGEAVPKGADIPGNWRACVEGMARGQLALYRAHPWLLKVNTGRTVLGPSALRSMEVVIAPLRTMGLSDPELLSVIIAVTNWVTGHARTEADTLEAVKETGLSDEEFWGSQRPFLERAMLSGEFPQMASLSEDTFSYEFDHFEFGLARLVDGFAALVEARGASDAGRADVADAGA